ncbi:MAG: phage terminase large subunit [Rickettsia sp.]|nr:phage terminase large subunit [Rickettsia sp.]
MEKYSKRFLDALLRQDFVSFLSKAFSTTNIGEEFIHNWHIDLISDYLEAIRVKHVKRLIINIPPRSLKSLCVNVMWTSWMLGCKPNCRIISASYSSALSIKHSVDARSIIQTDWYQNIFPHTRISPTQNQKYKFLTTQNGFRLATSVGGTLTGEGGDILIIDDPHNPVNINSNKMRNHTIEWFENSFLTRMNNKHEAVVIVIMQRLHQEDLSGYLISKGGWELLKIPALAQEDIKFTIFNKTYFFAKGSLMNSKLDNLESLTKLKNEIGNKNYSAQYLQSALKENFNLLSKNEISFYNQIPKYFSYFALSWDTAIKTSIKSDYTVCSCWGILNDCYYLVDLIREKMGYPLLKNHALHQIKKFNPKYVIIEDKSSGQSLIQDLYSEGFKNIYPIKPHQDKFTRFASIIPFFQSGNIILPAKSSFTQILVQEITSFPSTTHDDIVDSLSQFVIFIRQKSKSKNPNIRSL